ncbi:hypothetical protein PoB_002520900 [Plakobranchus ocellatus]|uniref:Uncharacterized protein n=1 Tax=Plakobranchus ocellatus TaxID=259542 RepID=A0AAV3ZWA7_9GAST|nr:hypothetical protein PoB_002520900 [Plakobranchus ocellatus]
MAPFSPVFVNGYAIFNSKHLQRKNPRTGLLNNIRNSIYLGGFTSRSSLGKSFWHSLWYAVMKLVCLMSILGLDLRALGSVRLVNAHVAVYTRRPFIGL